MKAAILSRINRMKLSTILRIFFIFIVIIPIAVISTIILQMYKQDLLKQATERTLQTSQTVAYSTKQEINKMVGIFASIGMDPDVLSTATSIAHTSSTDRYANTSMMYKMLNKHTSSVLKNVLSVKFFFKDAGSYTYLNNLEEDEQISRQSEWYKLSQKKQDYVHFLGMQKTSVYGEDRENIMAATFSPSDFNIIHNIDVMYFIFDGAAFDNILLQDTNFTSKFFLVTGNGQIVASNQQQTRQGDPIDQILRNKLDTRKAGHFIENIDGEKMLVSYAQVGYTDWKIINMVPYSVLIANYEKVYKFIIMAAMLVILSFAVISLYFVHNVTKPIHQLVRQMSRVMEGNMSTKIHASGNLELMTLGNTFNHMIETIFQLMKQHEEQEKAKSMAEFAVLQSQINPHFLINTLNAIKLMALISNADNIQNMTHSLIRLLSSSFNRGGRLVKLSEEVENLKHYLYIMEIRYGNKFEVVWNIEENTESCYLLKLLLQPIIENSLVHGLNGLDYGGYIHISASLHNGDLHICIEDNGVGVPETVIEKFQRQAEGPIKDQTYSGMGVLNVHQRIQLHYGKSYGLSIEVSETGGTRVRLTLPATRHSDENDDEGFAN